jgi:hypothetical protein
MIPVMRPMLPTAERLLPYLRQIDHARIYIRAIGKNALWLGYRCSAR